jgi:hypothetical protein
LLLFFFFFCLHSPSYSKKKKKKGTRFTLRSILSHLHTPTQDRNRQSANLFSIRLLFTFTYLPPSAFQLHFHPSPFDIYTDNPSQRLKTRSP